jgi:hypothetical protein
MKVIMTAISWIHDPDIGTPALQRNIDIMRSTDIRVPKGKIAERGNSGFAVR